MIRLFTTFALTVGLAMPAASWAQSDEPAKGGAPSKTDQQVAKEMKQDVVLRALVDELERGKLGLELEDLQRPYFLEYALRRGQRRPRLADQFGGHARPVAAHGHPRRRL